MTAWTASWPVVPWATSTRCWSPPRPCPHRDETLAHLETWITAVVADIADPADRHMVETFAVWRLLHRTRQQAGSLQSWIRRAVEFLAFLRDHRTTVAGCTQPHVDLWLAGPPARRQARVFLRARSTPTATRR